MFQPVETLQASIDRQICEGWARVANEYEPRLLNTKEQAQCECASLQEQIAQRTPFVLGKPL